MKKFVTGCYAAALVLSAALPAVASQAAPQYLSSEPSDGETVHQPPDRVEATFDEPLDGSSRLVVKDECGRRVSNRKTEVEVNTMSTTLTAKPSGEYHVEYMAVGLGGITGTATGHFTFTAHAGKACDGGSGGHNGHNGNNGKHGNGHEDNGHDSNGHDGNGHDGGGDHDVTDHSAGGGDHDRHGSTGDEQHSDHAPTGSGDHGNHDGNGSNENDDALASGEIPGITSPDDTARKLLSSADSTTLLVALGLCLALGVLGGAILRASGVR
ncbi:MAG: copper resistance protein CopC [Actinobacteria bacterium]|nr:copper resistance protein CopC [Actinomycetota bacterium]